MIRLTPGWKPGDDDVYEEEEEEEETEDEEEEEEEEETNDRASKPSSYEEIAEKSVNFSFEEMKKFNAKPRYKTRRRCRTRARSVEKHGRGRGWDDGRGEGVFKHETVDDGGQTEE